ncbi:unnamed protein product [Euphydryas editha]|uniref:Uncharacterized protein n=1 Tax=Euphydryas editha TaxID=104508 RepID=A0AAU9TKK4_EUPED|nr:unnamed protein product [Euphydryas editha]
MPFKKRRNSNNENTKEKKAIATRLMVISLKVDDYIYKNKPISLQEAQLYIEEIATYKFKCVNDVRSLQVIEKLTTLMKSIINENTVCHDSNENLNTESKTKSDAIEITNVTKILPNSVTNIDKENYIEKDNNIDFNNENNNQNKSHLEHQNIEMKTFKNVTNHTIINLNDDTNNVQATTLIDERNSNGEELNNDSIILIQNNQNKNTYLTIAENDIKDFEISNVTGNNNNYNNQNIQNSFDCDGEIGKNKQNLNTKDVETCQSLKNIQINDTPKDNDKQDKIEPTVKNPKRKPKNKTVRTKKAFKASDTDKNQNTNKISKKKCVIPNKNSKRNTKNKTDLSKTFVSYNNSVKKKITLKSYKETEGKEDLSWVENIKYVREVRKEEYDLQTLEETFWTDLTLPVDFNLNDFDYID